MSFYDSAQHHTDTGQALYDLALTGHKTQAPQRLAYAVAHHGKPYARSRAMTQTKLASLLMATSDPRQAAAIGQQPLTQPLTSRPGAPPTTCVSWAATRSGTGLFPRRSN
jgi:hypothetical protein